MRRRFMLVNGVPGGGGVSSYTISGTVYDADGSTAVEGATVALGALSAVSAANGTYTISGVAPGASGSMTCTKAGYSWTAITVAAMSGNLTGQNYTNAWWAAGGISANTVRAYQPKGAASLAASYINLANPGTGDASPPGSAPGWNTSTGWIFNNNVYLTTGYNPSGRNKTNSVAVRFTGATDVAAAQALIGMYSGSAIDSLLLFFAGAGRQYYSSNLYDQTAPPNHPASGTMIIAGNKAYFDGVEVGTIPAGNNLASLVVDIGGTAGTRLLVGNIVSSSIYDTAITPAQVAALHAAMVAL
jgi:hypothetical protein